MSVKMGSVLESKMSKSELSSTLSFTEYGKQVTGDKLCKVVPLCVNGRLKLLLLLGPYLSW